MNIGVFKDLNEQLQTVTSGTDIFRSKVVDLVKELQGLSSIISSMPQGLSGLAQQMQAAGGAFSAQKVTQSFQSTPATPSPTSGAGFATPPTQQNVATSLPADLNAGVTRVLSDFLTESKNLRIAIENLSKGGSSGKSAPLVGGAGKPDEPVFNAPTGNAPTIAGRLGIFTEEERNLAQRTFRQTGIKPASIEDTLAAERMTQPLSQARVVDNIDKLTDRLGRVEGAISKTLVSELEKIKSVFSANSDVVKNFNESMNRYNDAILQKRPEAEIQKAYEDLSRSVKHIADASERYGEAVRLGYETLGEQDAPAGFRSRLAAGLQRGLPYAAGIVAGGVDLARESFSFFKDMESQDIPATRQIAAARGQLEQRAFQNYSEQFSTYNARNLMKWYGDVLAPGSFEYSGPQGFQRAKETALTEQSREQELKETERSMQMRTGAGDIGMSVAQLIGSTMVKQALTRVIASTAAGAAAGSVLPGAGNLVGGAVGAYMAFDAVKDLISNVNKMQSGLAGSPALEAEGGRASTLYGAGVSGLYGNQPAEQIARRTRERFALERANENMDRARELQEAEVNRFPYMERALQSNLDLKRMQYQAMSSLGRYAGSPLGAIPGVTGLPQGVYEQSYEKSMRQMRGEAPVEDTAEQTFWKGFNKSAGLPIEITPRRESAAFARFAEENADAFRGISSQEREYLRTRFEATPDTFEARPQDIAGAFEPDIPVIDKAKDWLTQYRSPAEVARRKAGMENIAKEGALSDQRQANQKAFDDQMGIMLKRDEKGNYVNLPFANLGLSPTDVAQRAYSYQNMLGIGQMRTTGQVVGSSDFMRLNRMSISGLGSFDQLTQNVQGLQALTGQNANQAQKDLERIFSKGVEAGFNNSRLAQTLVQTTAGLSESLGLRNVSGVTSALLAGAGVAGGGRADERTLQEAARGTQMLASLTGAREGPMAAVRLGGILQGSMAPGQGGSLLYGMNSVQANDTMQQINELGGFEKAWELAHSNDPKDRQKIRDPNLRSMLFNAKAPGDLKASLEGVRRTGTVAASAAWNLFKGEGEQNLETTQAGIMKDLREARTEKDRRAAQIKLDDFSNRLRERFAATGQSPEMAAGYIGQMLSDPNLTPAQRSALRRQMDVMVPPEQKTQAAFQSAITQFGKSITEGKPTFEQYASVMAAGDMKRTLRSGEVLTGKEIAGLSKTDERRKEIEEGLGKETVSSLMAQRQMSMKEMTEPPKQMVMSGIEQTAADRIGEAIARAMKRENPTSQTPIFKSPFG
jgi:hypothetical protein